MTFKLRPDCGTSCWLTNDRPILYNGDDKQESFILLKNRYYIHFYKCTLGIKVHKIAEIAHSYSLNKHIIGQYGNPRFVVAIGLGYNFHEMAVA